MHQINSFYAKGNNQWHGATIYRVEFFSIIHLKQNWYDDYIKKFKNLTYEEQVIHSIYIYKMNQLDIFQMKEIYGKYIEKIRILKYK